MVWVCKAFSAPTEPLAILFDCPVAEGWFMMSVCSLLPGLADMSASSPAPLLGIGKLMDFISRCTATLRLSTNWKTSSSTSQGWCTQTNKHDQLTCLWTVKGSQCAWGDKRRTRKLHKVFLEAFLNGICDLAEHIILLWVGVGGCAIVYNNVYSM